MVRRTPARTSRRRGAASAAELVDERGRLEEALVDLPSASRRSGRAPPSARPPRPGAAGSRARRAPARRGASARKVAALLLLCPARPTSRTRRRGRGRGLHRSLQYAGCCRSSPCRTSRRDGTAGRSRRSARRSPRTRDVLDVHADADHNRSVFTLVGHGPELADALVAAVAVARERIDLRRHEGAHPRVGAADVVPSCRSAPTQPGAREAAAAELGAPDRRRARAAGLPLRRERAGRGPAFFRRGGPDELQRRLDAGELVPDFGPPRLDPAAGAVVVGARRPLIAFNVNLARRTLETSPARSPRVVRERGGGFPGVRALGLDLPRAGRVQVSMNVEDWEAAALHEVVARVEAEAAARGVEVAGSELVGLMPAGAAAAAAGALLRIDGFDAAVCSSCGSSTGRRGRYPERCRPGSSAAGARSRPARVGVRLGRPGGREDDRPSWRSPSRAEERPSADGGEDGGAGEEHRGEEGRSAAGGKRARGAAAVVARVLKRRADVRADDGDRDLLNRNVSSEARLVQDGDPARVLRAVQLPDGHDDRTARTRGESARRTTSRSGRSGARGAPGGQ